MNAEATLRRVEVQICTPGGLVGDLATGRTLRFGIGLNPDDPESLLGEVAAGGEPAPWESEEAQARAIEHITAAVGYSADQKRRMLEQVVRAGAVRSSG